MNKTSTLKLFTFLPKLLLVTVIVFCSAFIHPDLANAANGGIVQTKTIKCYPNPAVSFVNFDFLPEYVSKNYTLQVYSFTGKKMYEVNVTSIKNTLTFTSDFYRGIYIYQLQDKTGKIIETGKFQVTR
ncbi:MAG: T9SS type A sorting domain-containing protein [Parafilimonas sp.]